MADKTHETKQSNQAVNKQRAIAPVEHAAESIAIGAPGVEYTLADPYLASPAQLLALQRMTGNRAVSRLIQTKLTVGPAHDPYEQEADRVAEQVVSGQWSVDRHPPTVARPVQRQEEEEEEEVQTKPLVASITPLVQRQAAPEEEEVQTKPVSAADSFDVGSEFESQLSATRGGGSPLPDGVRGQMEQGFGADFSGVRVHTGGESAQLNRSVSAQAFTHGQDIYLGEGKSNIQSSEGQRLIAHELTHVVQQSGPKVARQPEAPPRAGRAAVQLSRTDSASLQRVLLTSKQIMDGLNRISRLQGYLQAGKRSLLDENVETEQTTMAATEGIYKTAHEQEERLKGGRLRQGLTLNDYITRVFENYDAQFKAGATEPTANAMRLAVALNSVGTAIAQKLHAPYAQSEITTELLNVLSPRLQEELKGGAGGSEQIEPEALNLAKTLVSDDPVGLYMQEKLALEHAAKRIVDMARTHTGAPITAVELFDLLSQKYQVRIGSYTQAEVAAGDRPELLFGGGHFAVGETYGEISTRYFGKVVQLEGKGPGTKPKWKAGGGGLELQPEKEESLRLLRQKVGELALAAPPAGGAAPGAAPAGAGVLTPAQQKYLADVQAREPALKATAMTRLIDFFRPPPPQPKFWQKLTAGQRRALAQRETDRIHAAQDQINNAVTNLLNGVWVIGFFAQDVFKDAANMPTSYKHFYEVFTEKFSLAGAIKGSVKEIERLSPVTPTRRGPDYGYHRFEKDLWATELANLKPQELPKYGCIQVVKDIKQLMTSDVYGNCQFVLNKGAFAGRVLYALEHYKERGDPVLLLADMLDKGIGPQNTLRNLANGVNVVGTAIEYHILGSINYNTTDIQQIALGKGIQYARDPTGKLTFTGVQVGPKEDAAIRQEVREDPANAGLDLAAREPLIEAKLAPKRTAIEKGLTNLINANEATWHIPIVTFA